MTKSATVSLASCLYLTNKTFSVKSENILSSWIEVVNHLMETCTIEFVIVKTEIEMQNIKLPSKKTPSEYSEAFWSKA